MTNDNKKSIKPFLKWAGGKRWLLCNHKYLFPKTYNRYFEPFLGSGAIYFGLQPNRAFIGDSNRDLIETYAAIRRNWQAVWQKLLCHRRLHNEEYYYCVRASEPRKDYARAARFIYLNRTCFNGIYRVNLNGVFNVPKGTKDCIIFSDDNFEVISNLLKSAHLFCGDFEKVISKANRNDFVYVDPPYTAKHNQNNFIKYNERIFRWEDQKRLAMVADKASRRGALILISNANVKSIMELYPSSRWHFSILNRTSTLSSIVSRRQQTTELIISNYPIQNQNEA
jgi:DNA adenine methylase